MHIRVPGEVRTRIAELAAELKLPESTTARLLLRRALDEPIGIAVIKEKVMQIHAQMRAKQAVISNRLRDMLLEMVDEIAPAVEADVPELPSAEEHWSAQLEEPREEPLPVAQPIVEDDPADHGAGVVFGGRRARSQAVPGRRKR